MTRRRTGCALVIGAAHEKTVDGPTAAVVDAERMSSLLEARGFEVHKLAGPDATRDGILAAYVKLIERVNHDEAAVVYFTGHGALAHHLADGDDAGILAQVSTAPERFQFIVPSDYLQSTEEDFRGISAWELSLLLEELTRKTHNVTVILDFCHSAQMSRVSEQASVAEPPPIELTRSLIGRHLAVVEVRRPNARTAQLDPRGNPYAVRLTASGEWEKAFARFDDQQRPTGVLTHALIETLEEIGDLAVSWHVVGAAIRERLRQQEAIQLPRFEGPVYRRLFSLDKVDGVSIPIVSGKAGLQLEAGRIAGVSVGDVYGVAPGDAEGFVPMNGIARVRVEQVSGLWALVRPLEWLNGHMSLPAHAVAWPLQLVRRQPVRVVAPEADLPRLEAAITASPRLRLAEGGERATAELRLQGGQLEVIEAGGTPLRDSSRPWSIETAISVRDVGQSSVVRIAPDSGTELGRPTSGSNTVSEADRAEPAATHVAVQVYAPTYLRSSAELALVRFNQARNESPLWVGAEEVRVAAGIYRILTPEPIAIARIEGDDIEALAAHTAPSVRALATLGSVDRDALDRFLTQERVATLPSPVPIKDPVILTSRGHAEPRPGSFRVTSARSVTITIYDTSGELLKSGEDELDLQLPPGLYRVRFRRGGVVHEQLVDHVRRTEVSYKDSQLRTPAPIAWAETSYEYYWKPAERFSLFETWSTSLEDLSGASLLLVFIRRESDRLGPPLLPSEPITLHHHDGRRLAVLDQTTSHIDNKSGYLAFSCRVNPGTYRLRALHSCRDIAITIPSGYSAHVFIADRGRLVIEDLRVSIVPVGTKYDPLNQHANAMEDAIVALRSPHGDNPASIAELPLEAVREDLCLGIAAAHLAWRSGDVARFEQLMCVLRACEVELPDLSILDRVARRQALATHPALSAPPLFHDSLAMALTTDDLDSMLAPGPNAFSEVASMALHDSIWCTWSRRPWSERWIEPTVEAVLSQDPQSNATSIARCLHLPRRVVERAIARLTSVVPRVDGTNARPDRMRVPGYALGEVLGRGDQGIVFKAVRERDLRAVALKIMPTDDSMQWIHELDRLQALVSSSPHLMTFDARGELPDGAGIWLEMELYEGSLLGQVARRNTPQLLEDACRTVMEALDGLADLHSRGVAHGAIKPSNLLIRRDGSIALSDFGLDRSRRDLRALSIETIQFSPRERLLDYRDVSCATDVWSMAATLYFLITLELPRERYSDQTELQAALQNPFVPIAERRPDVPPRVAECIDRALSANLQDHPRDAIGLRSQLRSSIASARPRLEAAVTTSPRLRLAEGGERAVAELRLKRGQLEVRTADGVPLRARSGSWSIETAVQKLRDLAAARMLGELRGEGFTAEETTEIEVEWGTLHGGVRCPQPGDGAAVSEGDQIYVAIHNRSTRVRYAHVFNIDQGGAIARLSAVAAAGILLVPQQETFVGPVGAARPEIKLTWPEGLPRDAPTVDRLVVIVTVVPCDLGMLESTGRRARSSPRGVEVQPQEESARHSDELPQEPFHVVHISWTLHPRPKQSPRDPARSVSPARRKRAPRAR